MNVWLKFKCVWTLPVSGFLGFPVTGSGEMWRSKAAMGCFLGSCSSLFFIVPQMFLIKGCFNLKMMK